MVYYIENEHLIAGIKSAGAELTTLKSKSTDFEYLWQGNPDVWYGQSPVLFPIIGRVLDDKYYLDGKEYSMPKHGLFRKREASVVSHEKSKITFVEKEDDDTLAIFPYRFDVYVTFELIGKSVKCSYEVVNNNDKTMYFSIGGHPGFNCEIGDYLRFDEKETLATVAIDTECLRNGNVIPVLNDETTITITKDIFNDDALIFNGIKSQNITLESDKHSRKVKFDMGRCPYLGIWAKPAAPYVCIEPWWGVNDDHVRKSDFSEKDCIQSAAAGEKFNCYWLAEIIE